jgi:hypothetical protein
MKGANMPNSEYTGPIVKFEKNGDNAPDKLWITEGEEVINFWADRKTGKKITEGVDVQALVDSGVVLNIKINSAKAYEGITQWYGNSLQIEGGQRPPAQRTETPQNKPARTKDQDIHWQVAIKGAIDLLKDNKEDWTYDYLLGSIEEISNRIYDIIEAGPHAEIDTDVSNDDSEDNVVMEV